MKCELCKENEISSKKIIMFENDIEKWQYKLCSECSQMIDTWFTSKASEARLKITHKEIIEKIKINRANEWSSMRRYIIYVCKSCKHIFEWIDDRFPNYCPECGDDVPKSTGINIDGIVTQMISISNEGLKNV